MIRAQSRACPPPPQRPAALTHSHLRAAAAALFVLTLATLAAGLTGATGTWRLVLTTAFAITAPGFAVLAYARSASPAFIWSVGIAVSIAIGIILAQTLLLLRFWHPAVALAVLGLFTLPVLAHHVWRNR